MASIHKEGSLAVDKYTEVGPSVKKPRIEHSRVTKNITDIFAADPPDLTETGTSSTERPKRILIEGAPGIGKTILAKEIAYQWATNKILTETKIFFLIYLRDIHLQSIISTKQLVQYMSMGCLDDEQITTFDKYLVNTKGQQLCIVMDGFDEYPSLLQQNSLIVKIINGAILPEAIVVITSRPTATVSLHDQVDRRIDILGLPKEEREKYISQTFSNSSEKKDALDKYLKQQPVINGLCFVPLHLAILLYLFQQGSLPETLTEMNESFILHTIYRHLKRYGQTTSGAVDKLAKVPKPILDIVYNLSELAFKGLQDNKLVFTFEEVKEVCPNVDDNTVGNINGFGLLQAVEYYPQKGAGTTTSFNFLHYTMQEYLAALHVSNLPSEQQSSLMEKIFWDGHYNFMWMMFVGIVGIKSDIFVNFVSKGKVYKRKSEVRIAIKFRKDKMKLLHVFQCYLEAKENTEIPEVISSLFKDGKVIFSKVQLLPHNVTSLMSFICTKQSIQWKTLELQQCEIGDIGMSVLWQFISENTSTLEYVDLSNNDSSPWGVYCAIIRHCSVNSLTLCGDHGIENYASEIKERLQMNTKLLSLTLCNIGNNGAITLAEAIQVNTTLQKINISDNSISDDGATAIINSIKFNTSNSLQELNISQNNITNDGIKVLAEVIEINSTLQNINISKNHIAIEGLMCFMKAVKNNCSLQVVNITHNNVTRSGFTSIKQCIENLQRSIQIYASWNEIVSRNGELLVKSKICTFQESENIIEDEWSFKDYDRDHIVTCLSECLKEDDMLLELNMSNNQIIRGRKKKIIEAISVNKTLLKLDASLMKIQDESYINDCLKINKSLKELNISENEITSNGAKEIATAIRVNTTLEKLDLSCNALSDDGAGAIIDSLQFNNSLQELNISKNKITSEGVKKIATAIRVNTTLEKLDLSCNEIANDGVSFISDGFKSNNSLQEVNISRNKITSEGAQYISDAIRINTTLAKLDLSCNALSDDGAAAISDGLQFNNSLQELNISKNEITSEGVTKIAQVIRVNTTLKHLDLSINKITDDGAYVVGDGLQSNISIQELNISHNSITNKGIKKITEAIQTSLTLQNINISKNNISIEGLLCFMEAVKNNCTLQVVNITHNNVTRSGFTSIKQCTENLQHPVQIYASWNEINESGKLVTKISTSCAPDNIEDDVWSFDEYDADHLVMCLSECLKEDYTLQELNMSINKITNEGAKMIGEAIKVNKTLQKLDISGNSISDDVSSAISDGVKCNISLQELDMSSNKVTNEGAKMIGEAIKVNKTLQKLDISGNSISDDGSSAISDGVKCNISLQELDMSSNKVTNEGAKMIGEAIKVNKTLQKLYITHNRISDDGAAAISDGLKCNISLQQLNMSWNKITNDGAKMIGEAIKVNKTLQKLYITGNSISDDGAAVISDGLKCNISLQELNMSWNKITNEGAKMIGEAIKVNKTLQKLDISHNSISDDGAAAISDGLKCNISLQQLNISYNKITNEGAKMIAEAIKVNTTLHTLNLRY